MKMFNPCLQTILSNKHELPGIKKIICGQVYHHSKPHVDTSVLQQY